MHLSNRKGPDPRGSCCSTKYGKKRKNTAAFAWSFKNPLGPAWAEAPTAQGTGQLHPFLTMNFLCICPQN